MWARSCLLTPVQLVLALEFCSSPYMEYIEKMASEESLGEFDLACRCWGLGGRAGGISNLRGVGGTRTRMGASIVEDGE